MGYIFLMIALFCGAGKGFCGKKVSVYVQGFKDSMLANSLRMILCIAIGLFFVLIESGTKGFLIDSKTLMISALSGVCTAAFVIFWLISVKSGSYMVLDVFLTLGVIFATVLCRIFFNEPIQPNQYIGFVILIIAAAIMCSYTNSSIGKLSVKSFVLLLLTGLANGLTSFSQKMFIYTKSEASSAVFNFYTYVFAAVVLVVGFMFLKRCNHQSENSHSSSLIKSVIGYIVIMAICLFANSYFLTLTAGELDAAIMYPLNQGVALIITTFMSVIFFKEKLSIKCVVGMGLTFVSLMVINLL